MEETEKAAFVLDIDRWIGELNESYWKIVNNPDIPAGNLDNANDIICETIEKLRPLTKTYAENTD